MNTPTTTFPVSKEDISSSIPGSLVHSPIISAFKRANPNVRTEGHYDDSRYFSCWIINEENKQRSFAMWHSAEVIEKMTNFRKEKELEPFDYSPQETEFGVELMDSYWD